MELLFAHEEIDNSNKANICTQVVLYELGSIMIKLAPIFLKINEIHIRHILFGFLKDFLADLSTSD